MSGMILCNQDCTFTYSVLPVAHPPVVTPTLSISAHLMVDQMAQALESNVWSCLLQKVVDQLDG